MTSLALFDLDNTLLDREKVFALWANQFVAVHGLDADALPTIERVDADGHEPRERFFTVLRSELGVTTSVEVLLADYSAEDPSKYEAEPEVIDAVRSLRAAEFKVGVVTNGPPSQWAKLEAAGIADEFDAVCISAVIGARTLNGPSSRRRPDAVDSRKQPRSGSVSRLLCGITGRGRS